MIGEVELHAPFGDAFRHFEDAAREFTDEIEMLKSNHCENIATITGE